MKLSEILIQILKKRSHNLAGGIIAIFVVPIVINLLVFIGLIRAYTRIRKSYNGINGMLSGFAINICDASLLIVFFFFWYVQRRNMIMVVSLSYGSIFA